ncbi:MAG: hypothetical protein V1874_17280 [Spirochaetota bacterium]
MKKILFMLLISFLSAQSLFAKKDIKIYKSIEFKDIKYLSKYEIIDKVDLSIKEKSIIIDINSLENVLNNHPMINTFKLTESNQTLSISIVENQPIFLLSIRDGEKNIPVEIGKDFNIVSVGRFHAPDKPVIVISREDVKSNMISARLKRFLNLLSGLNKSGLSVIKEITEIDCTDFLNIKLLLRGRRTVFIVRPDKDNFNKLNYAAGYFDRIKYYPHTFSILNGAGILK